MKEKLSIIAPFIAGAVAILLLGAGNGNTGKTVARDPGTKAVVSGTSAVIFPARGDRQSFCLKADKANTDILAFSLSGTATANSMLLNPGDSYCNPIGGEAAYQGPVSWIAVTTAGTHNGLSQEN